MSEIQTEREELFRLLEDPETRPRFWERVADDVHWTVEGTHVCRFDGDKIVEVRAYLDSAMIAWTLLRNEPKPS